MYFKFNLQFTYGFNLRLVVRFTRGGRRQFSLPSTSPTCRCERLDPRFSDVRLYVTTCTTADCSARRLYGHGNGDISRGLRLSLRPRFLHSGDRRATANSQRALRIGHCSYRESC